MADRPNVVHILTDDQRAELLGAAGHPILETPNLDALAADGVRFRNAFCTSPACTPSRTSHYLGQWERRHGVNFNSDSAVAPEAWAQSFPERLRSAGYCLGWVGKNHVPVGPGGYRSGHLESRFDYFCGNHGHSGFYPKHQAGQQSGGYVRAAADTQPEVFAEAAMSFLDPDPAFLEAADPALPARDPERPFCLCVTFNLPHAQGTGQMQLRPGDDALYRTAYRDRFEEVPLPDTYVPMPEVREPRLPRWLYSGQYLPEYDYVRAPTFLRERRIREYQAIAGIDRFVGQLRAKLAELGEAENTVIVFSTDHGIHHGEHGLGGKCFLYEQDLRVPLIVHDPRMPASARGQARDEMVAVPDLAPTVLELAGEPAPATMQGQSLAPLLRGEAPAWRDALFAEQLMDIQNYPRSECVRTADWKYVRYFARTEDPAQADRPFRGTLDDYDACLTSSLRDERPAYEELFDLRNDPGETTNRAGESEHAETLASLRERLGELGWAAKGDPGPPATVR